MVDADNAKQVVMLTEELLPYPHNPASIEQDQVDLIVKVDRVGDAAKIGAGATRMTTNPRELLIARSAADVIVNSGYFQRRFLHADRHRRRFAGGNPFPGRQNA